LKSYKTILSPIRGPNQEVVIQMEDNDKFANRIIVINDKLYGPSLGTPTESIVNCTGSENNLYTYIYDKSNINKEIRGKKLLGVYPPISSGWFINTSFQDFIFRKFKKYVKENSKTHLIHYTSQQVKPFHFQNSTVTVHDLVPLIFPEETKKAVVKLTKKNIKFYRKLPITLTVSNFIKNSLLDYGFEGQIHVIYQPVSKSYFPIEEAKDQLRKRMNLPLNKKLVLSVSANYPRKNLKIMEETMEVLGNDYLLVRVGTPIKNSINFTNISNEELNMLYNACDVFFMPSKYEGFGLPMTEAFAAGIPVVASDIDVFKEVSNGSALLCPQDSKLYAESIIEAINYNSEFRMKGLRRAAFFSNENYCEQLRIFYKEAFKIYGL